MAAEFAAEIDRLPVGDAEQQAQEDSAGGIQRRWAVVGAVRDLFRGDLVTHRCSCHPRSTFATLTPSPPSRPQSRRRPAARRHRSPGPVAGADRRGRSAGPSARAWGYRQITPAAAAEATGFGHDYVSCEHLLLGLVAETDGAAGKILRSLCADPRLTRRAVSAALAGYVHLSAQKQAAVGADRAASLEATVRREVQPLVERIERLEAQLGPNA
jgi:hypothetical protein